MPQQRDNLARKMCRVLWNLPTVSDTFLLQESRKILFSFTSFHLDEHLFDSFVDLGRKHTRTTLGTIRSDRKSGPGKSASLKDAWPWLKAKNLCKRKFCSHIIMRFVDFFWPKTHIMLKTSLKWIFQNFFERNGRRCSTLLAVLDVHFHHTEFLPRMLLFFGIFGDSLPCLEKNITD